mgnify:CR=1 FL=1
MSISGIIFLRTKFFCYLCYYPHMLRDSLSPIYRILSYIKVCSCGEYLTEIERSNLICGQETSKAWLVGIYTVRQDKKKYIVNKLQLKCIHLFSLNQSLGQFILVVVMYVCVL